MDRSAVSPIVHVVVLYVHPLLGEGLASLLSAETGVVATAVARDDVAGTARAMQAQPDLVIVESAEQRAARGSSARSESPQVVLTGFDTAGACPLGQPLADPDAVIAAARAVIGRLNVPAADARVGGRRR